MPPRVFLSYARQDAQGDSYFETFYKDLLAQLRMLTGAPAEEVVVFRDTTNLDVGSRWPGELGAALGNCASFVPIYSPAYFQRPYCGREWSAFERRLREHARQAKVPPPALIRPILWVPLRQMQGSLPGVVSTLNWTHGSFGEAYAADGLQHLLRMDLRHEYNTFLRRFAEKLLDGVRASPLAERAPIDLANEPNAFEAPQPVGQAPDIPRAAGPKNVEFIVIAAPAQEFNGPQVPPDDSHGEDHQEWRPFSPEDPHPVVSRLQAAASQDDFVSRVDPWSPDLALRLNNARLANRIVIVVVDAWTMQLDAWRGRVGPVDARHDLNLVVLVPWRAADRNPPVAEHLSQAVTAAFPNKTGWRDSRMFCEPVGLDRLEDQVKSALLEARRRIMEIGEVMRRMPTANAAAPTVDGPGAPAV